MNELRLEVPRLNPLPFIVADAVLVVTAALIGWFAPAPISPLSLAAVALCVAGGAVALLYPFVVNHARRQEEALQDRANQIEALARTVSACAEQISIAVSNLPAVAENSARQLKAAELLPTALKEQLAGLQQQLSATASEENAALRHELDTLRSAETTKLVAALEGLSLATADLARLEKLAAQHSAALDHAVAQIPKIADSFGKQASETLHRETTAAIKALEEAATQAGQALAAATNDARQAFDRGVRDAVTHLATQAASNPPFPAHAVYRPVISAPGPAEKSVSALLDPEASPAGESLPPLASSAPAPAPAPEPEATPTAEPEPVQEVPSEAVQAPVAEIVEPAPPAALPALDDATSAEIELQSEPTSPDTSPALETAPAAETLIDDTDLDEPDAVPALIDDTEPDSAAEAAILDSDTEAEAESESTDIEDADDADTDAAEEDDAEEDEAEVDADEDPDEVAEEDDDTEAGNESTGKADDTEPEAPAEPADSTSPAPEPEPAPAPELAFDPEPAPAISAEPALTNDGYTRLIATAYIGIGNKLFIRGDGPGLRRDKGVPLQFISIGKWRWESAELLFPVKAKLYKNDQLECIALGEVTLEPGHHHEVNATF